MFSSSPETWRAVIFITIALGALSATLVASIILSRRKFVTIRREKLDALRESELRFRSLIEHSFDAIVITDADDKILFASPSTTRVIGYVPEELIGRRLQEFLYADPIAGIQSPLRKSSPGGSAMIQGRVGHKDGSFRWIEGMATNMLNEPGVNAIVINYRDVSERRLAEEQLERSRNDLRALSTHLQSIREDERTIIAREIHDELGQLLTVLKMDLVLLERELDKKVDSNILTGAHADIRTMMNMIDGIIQSVRRIATELRPEILDELGLKDAIEWETELFEGRTGVKCLLNLESEELNLGKEKNTAMFRVFQEALTNIARHSHATSMTVNLNHRDGLLVLEVIDNGCGAREQDLNSGTSLGILGMRERTLVVGGELTINGHPGSGTVVRVQVPVSHGHDTSVAAMTPGQQTNS